MSADETKQLVEGLRTEVAANQQDTIEATARALETVGGQIEQVREMGEQRHAESIKKFTEGLEANRKDQELRHQESMKKISVEMEGARREHTISSVSDKLAILLAILIP